MDPILWNENWADIFQKMVSEAEKPYGSPELKSRYQGQLDPTESRVFEDFEKQISKKNKCKKKISTTSN